MEKILKIKDDNQKSQEFLNIKQPDIIPLQINKTTTVFHIVSKGLIVKRFISRDDVNISEIKLALEVDHENIVTTYLIIREISKTPKIHWMFMEYLPLEINLNKSYDLYENYAICENVCNGLKYLHSKNIVHLDIKYNNIMGKFKNSFDNDLLALNSIFEIYNQIKDLKLENIYTYELNQKYIKYEEKQNNNSIIDYLTGNFSKEEIENFKNNNYSNYNASSDNFNTSALIQNYPSNPTKKIKLDTAVELRSLNTVNNSYSKNDNDYVHNKTKFFFLMKQNICFLDIEKKYIKHSIKFYVFIGNNGVIFEKKYDDKCHFTLEKLKELIISIGEYITNEQFINLSLFLQFLPLKIYNYVGFFSFVFNERYLIGYQPLLLIMKDDENYYKKKFFLADHLTYKIIDFGNAIEIKNHNNNLGYHLYGTKPCIPPEIFFYKIFFYKTDIWNLGTLSYNIFSKEDPFFGIKDIDKKNKEEYDKYVDYTQKNTLIKLENFKWEEKYKKYHKFILKCIKYTVNQRYNSDECLSVIRENLEELILLYTNIIE
ncbi:hypothetical protein GVAV_000626 [Gurleya vavrai]